MTRKTRRKTTIITETDRLLVFNRKDGSVEGWCDDLESFLDTLQREEVPEVTAFRMQPVRRLIDSGLNNRAEGAAVPARPARPSALKTV